MEIFLCQGATNSQLTASARPCADCAGSNPFVNPYDPSHQTGHVQQPQQQASFTYNNNNNYPTTEQPRAFFPPGKLNLNRFETGFNFDFES